MLLEVTFVRARAAERAEEVLGARAAETAEECRRTCKFREADSLWEMLEDCVPEEHCAKHKAQCWKHHARLDAVGVPMHLRRQSIMCCCAVKGPWCSKVLEVKLGIVWQPKVRKRKV